MGTWYVDPINGDDSHTGNSFAQRVENVGSLASVVPGDTIRLMESIDPHLAILSPAVQGQPASIGTASWNEGQNTVVLTTPQTTILDNFESASIAGWTGIHASTIDQNNDHRQGLTSIQLVGTTTNGSVTFAGLAYRVVSTVLSTDSTNIAYYSFSIKTSSAIPANTFSLVQASSNTSAITIAQEIPIPAIGALNKWIPITVAVPCTGAGGTTTCLSLAIINRDSGGLAYNFLLDNFQVWFGNTITPTGSGLNLTSLISKNNGTDTWYAIRSIDGVFVTLDASPALNTSIKYPGVTESVATYKRETTVFPGWLLGGSGSATIMSISGTLVSSINIFGGWNASSMDTQVGETWIDGLCGGGIGFFCVGDNINLDKFYQVRFNEGIEDTGNNLMGNTLTNFNTDTGLFVGGSVNLNNIYSATGNAFGVFANSGAVFNAQNCYNIDCNQSGGGLDLNNVSYFNIPGTIQARYHGSAGAAIILSGGGRIGDITIFRSTTRGLSFKNTTRIDIRSADIRFNASDAMIFNGSLAPVYIYNLNSALSGGATCNLSNPYQTECYVYNAYMNDNDGTVFFNTGFNSRLYSNNEKLTDVLYPTPGTVNNNHVYTDGGDIIVDTASPNTFGGLDYKINITLSTRTINYPIKVKIGSIFYIAGSLVTFTARIKRTSSAISARLVLLGGSYPGSTTDIFTDVSGSGYNTYTLTFTPLLSGATDVFLHVWSGTSTTDSVSFADCTLVQL